MVSGTSVRPLASPKAVPFQTLPVTSWIGRVAISAPAGAPPMQGKIEVDPMITHTLPLARINEGFGLMHEGKSIRAVVVY